MEYFRIWFYLGFTCCYGTKRNLIFKGRFNRERYSFNFYKISNSTEVTHTSVANKFNEYF